MTKLSALQLTVLSGSALVMDEANLLIQDGADDEERSAAQLEYCLHLRMLHELMKEWDVKEVLYRVVEGGRSKRVLFKDVVESINIINQALKG